LVLALAFLEDTFFVGGGGVVLAADAVINMLTIVGSIRPIGIADFETEYFAAEEVVPLDNLFIGGGVATAGRESVAVDERAKRVAATVGAVGVFLTTRIPMRNINH